MSTLPTRCLRLCLVYWSLSAISVAVVSTTAFAIEPKLATTKSEHNKEIVCATKRYAGIYRYGTSLRQESVGCVTVYPESDSTILFFIDLNNGPPNFHAGTLYARARMHGDTAEFLMKLEDPEETCQWRMIFSANSLQIQTVDGNNGCGFGFGVYADGEYRRRSNAVVEFFKAPGQQKTFFSKTSPEKWSD